MLPTNKLHKTVAIEVAEKIIADISTGIYRTPAAALKEMVANAYDADATRVDIATGAPDFRELVIRDNGTGMTIERFINVVQHIGGSWKRLDAPGGVSPVFKRPLVGRIGIGLLAVAQLGQRFYVSSSVRGTATRFIAEVDLAQFHKEDSALRKLVGDSDKKVEIGLVRYVDDLPERQNAHYTIITVPDPKQGLVSELHSQLREVMDAPQVFSLNDRAQTFSEIVNVTLESNRADAVLDGYYYVLWELGLLSPVCYLDGPVFAIKKRRVEDAYDLHRHDPAKFELRVDGYDIRRPLRFPNPVAVSYGGPDPKVYPVQFNGDVAGRRLAISGYIYAQKPRIQPVELQGIHIRVRGVGVGGYDKSWMGYPFDEGIKFGQLSGEMFVDEGLESALNIDRASFRETDPHYLTLRAMLWDRLRREVFPEFKSRQKGHRNTIQRQQTEKHRQALATALADAPEPVGVSASIVSDRKSTKDLARFPVAVIDGEVVVRGSVLDALAGQPALNPAARQRFLDVCAALAAYGLWDQMSATDAEKLLRALAVAVSK